MAPVLKTGVVDEATVGSNPTPSAISRDEKHVSIDELSYRICRIHDAQATTFVDGAYAFWHEGWQRAHAELGSKVHLHSDEFNRQDEIACILRGDDPIALTCFRWLDTSSHRHANDSFFSDWNAETLKQIAGRSIMIASNTIVDRDWRRTSIEHPDGTRERISFTLSALSVKRLHRSSASCLIGHARNDRSMDRVAARLGSQCIGKIKVHGVETDIILIERAATAYDAITNELWERRSRC